LILARPKKRPDLNTSPTKKAAKKAVKKSSSDEKRTNGKIDARAIEVLERCYLANMTDEQAADIICVHVRTIHAKKKSDPKFAAMANNAKKLADIEIVSSLLMRAKGYNVTKKGIQGIFDKIKKDNALREHHAPSIEAIKFWLTNRDKKNWKSRQIVAFSEDDYLTDDQLDHRLKMLLDQVGIR